MNSAAPPRTRHRLTQLFLGCVALACCGGLPARATTVRPPAFERLVKGSDYVVHGVVRAVTAEKRLRHGAPKIITRVDVEVLEVITGTAPQVVSLELLGGQVGTERLFVDGMPRFEPGDEEILFVQGNGRSICPLFAMMHGRYSVVAESGTGRKLVRRSDGMPLQNTAQISTPLAGAHPPATGAQRPSAASALTAGEFIRHIKAVANESAQRAK